jgi:hypothetical protein
MLDFHLSKLLQIRRRTLSRKMLVLKTYAHLRDADAKSFYHESMTETIWSLLSQLTMELEHLEVPPSGNTGSAGAGGAGGAGKAAAARCSHCCSVSIHKILKLEPFKRTCVFKDLTLTAARKAASKAVAEHKENPRESFWPESRTHDAGVESKSHK